MKTILTAIDFDNDTQKLLIKTEQLAKAFEAKVWILHVAVPNPDFVGYEVGPQYIRDARAKELKDESKLIWEHVDHLREKGISAEGLLIPGQTIETVLSEAEKLQVELIIVGHNNHSFLYEIVLGDIATDIAIKSNIPVLVVPIV